MKRSLEYLNLNDFSFLLVALIFASCAQPKLENIGNTDNKYALSTEADLVDESHINSIDSLYDSGEEGNFLGADGLEIYHKSFVQDGPEQGAIVISSGRTEAAIKYKEVIYDLYNNGYSVYIHDHRGQGFSGRMLANTDMGYVDEFQFYIDDLKQFYDDVVHKSRHSKYFLLAHSMGGAIGATYLEQNPRDFTAAAFSSPMLGLVFPSCPVVSLVRDTEPKYVLGNSDYEEGLMSFEENTLTGSKLRYERMNQEFEDSPEARIGGATYQWVEESCNQFDVIFDNISKIETPLVLFSGGNEEIVDPKAHNAFVDQIVSLGVDAKGYLVDGAKHELLIESDDIRIEVMTTILDFYSEFE